MAQLVKNLPAMWEIWVRFLVWKDPLEKGKATHSSILAWRIPWTLQSMDLQSQTRLSDFHYTLREIITAGSEEPNQRRDSSITQFVK